MTDFMYEYDVKDPYYEKFRGQAPRGVRAASGAPVGEDPNFRRVVAESQARAAEARNAASTATVRPAAPPAAVSAPVAENPAPVATARAASTPTFGQRLLGGVKSLGRAAAVAAPVIGAAQTALASPDEVRGFAQTLDLDYDSTGGRIAANVLHALRATGDVASFGTASGVGRLIAGDSFFAPPAGPTRVAPGAGVENPGGAQAAPQAAPAPLRGVRVLDAAAAREASARFFDREERPESGTGYVRRGDQVVAIDSRNEPVVNTPRFYRVSETGPYISMDTGNRLVRDKNGNLVEPPEPTGGLASSPHALANFAATFEREARRLGVANPNLRDVLATVSDAEYKTGELSSRAEDRRANREIQADNAYVGELKALADLIEKRGKERMAGVKLASGPTGEPVIVDLKTNTQRAPTKIPSEAEFIAAQRKEPANKSLTDQQLKAIYKQKYGG